MCSCLSEGEPAAVRRGQWAAAVQLAPEIVLLLVSIFTLRDGGYLGIGGGATALLACSAPLACCRVPRAAAFARLTCANLVATGWCAAQAAILLSRLATVDDWCCALTASSATSSAATITPGGMRAFLAALVALVGGGCVYRVWVGCGPARAAARAARASAVAPSSYCDGGGSSSSSGGGGSVAVGVPVAVPSGVRAVS